ncbi:MAG: zeta toxin family protein [Bacteroidetes bacterium]|nr:zeta toxin family protein [Bacteroidota bacterium]
MEEFPVSSKDWDTLFEIIQTDRTVGLSTISTPHFFLHAGQPGCGKTELNNLVSKQLSGNILQCNADTLRDYHPDVEKILREREVDYPILTWSAANSWNNALIKLGMDRRYNLLIETTLHNADLALQTLKKMKECGYTTNLQILAVPYRWSWLGIHIRYEAVKARKGFARNVSEVDHDNRFESLKTSLGVVLESPHLDHAAIYQRKLTIEPNDSTALQLVTDVKAKAIKTFFDIIEQPMDEQERGLFKRDCTRVIEYMHIREAPAEEIFVFNQKADRYSR